MNILLKIGQTLNTTSGLPCLVEEFIGAGGQGEVYRARLGTQSLALKWYFPDQATRQQHEALQILVRRGPPSEHFLWPLDLVTGPAGSFGYLMPLRDRRFLSAVDFMRRKVDPGFRIVATMGLNLAQEFLLLH